MSYAWLPGSARLNGSSPGALRPLAPAQDTLNLRCPRPLSRSWRPCLMSVVLVSGGQQVQKGQSEERTSARVPRPSCPRGKSVGAGCRAVVDPNVHPHLRAPHFLMSPSDHVGGTHGCLRKFKVTWFGVYEISDAHTHEGPRRVGVHFYEGVV